MIDQFLSFVLQLIQKILTDVVTLDSVIIVSCIIILVEFFKQYAKSKFGEKHSISHLENWEIRGITILLGCLLTFGIMPVNYKLRLIYGIFYGGCSFGAYWAVKHLFVKKIFPELNKRLSGQDQKE